MSGVRNPIYQALRTVGIIEQLECAARRTGAHANVYDAVRKDRAALRSMHMRGVISYEEYRDLRAKCARTLHARLLRDYMGRSDLRDRRRATRTITRICPPGTSSYAFRMGRTVHV